MTRNPIRLRSAGRFRAAIFLVAVGGGASSCSIYDESLLSPGSGGAVSSGGAPSANGGSLPSTDGSATGGAAGAAAGGSAGTASDDGAADSSTGDSGDEAPCGTNQKRCDGVCGEQTPLNGCSASACTACPPAPAYGVSTCSPTGDCSFDCLPGFTIGGNGCVPSTGAGGGTGDGGAAEDGGIVRCGFTNCVRCPPPHITCCERTTGNACLCAPPDYAWMLCR